MATDVGKEIFDGIVRGQRFAAEAERSFQDAVATMRRGDCWGCGHKAHRATECPTSPTFRFDGRNCRCTVDEGQL